MAKFIFILVFMLLVISAAALYYFLDCFWEVR